MSWGWDGVELLHHAQVVVDYPPFRDLPALKAEDVYAPDAELLASGWNAKDLVDVLEVMGMPGHDPVPLGDKVLHVGVPLSETREEGTEPLLNGLSSVPFPKARTRRYRRISDLDRTEAAPESRVDSGRRRDAAPLFAALGDTSARSDLSLACPMARGCVGG